MNHPIQKHITEATARQIVRAVEAALAEGALLPGDPLPTVRGLAGELGVSPGMVAAAYRGLRARGVISTEGRRGTRIAPRPGPQPRVDAARPAGLRDLSFGNPDRALLPDMRPALARVDGRPHLYGEAAHLPALVEQAARDFAAEGVAPGPISVVSGALAGIERALREHLRPGDRVAVEDPGFSNIFDLVVSLGLDRLPVEVDEAGMRPEALARALEQDARAVIATPRAQNPTGAAFSPERARALGALLAAAPDTLVIEDDHAGPVCDTPPCWLHGAGGRDPHPHWVLVRSFSKSLNPDLRLAVVTGDAETMSRLDARLAVSERWVSHVLQQITAALLADPEARSAVARAREAYARRRRALVDALAAEGIGAQGGSGFNVWVPVPEEGATVQGLMARGWWVAAGERFRLRSPRAIRITTADLRVAEAPRLAADLAQVLHGAGRGRTRGA